MTVVIEIARWINAGLNLVVALPAIGIAAVAPRMYDCHLCDIAGDVLLCTGSEE